MSDGGSQRGVREATAADRAVVVRTLTAAFHDDPLMRWVFPHEQRRADALRRLFEIEFDSFLRDGQVFVGADGAGAATWLPPGVKESFSVLAALRHLPQWLRACGPWHLTQAARAFGMTERRKPQEPHYYLATLGVAPGHQGQGVGSALIEVMTPRIDAEGMPAYLLSSNARNLPLYERHGFRVMEELQVPWGGPMLWPMDRERVS